MTSDANRIPEVAGMDRDRFDAEVRPAARPLVMRGLARDWPLIAAGRAGPESVAAALKEHATSQPLNGVAAPPECEGRFGYRDGLEQMNFRRGTVTLARFVDRLLEERAAAAPSAMAIQSAAIREVLPGLAPALPMPLVDPAVGPKIWIGNRVVVATHRDPMENVAVVAAGRRRFTLFPPEQIGNLYVGPLEFTPAGVPISLVDLDAPDFARFPRFAAALETAQVADLEPGDALYIPYLWWHHVRSLDDVNVLVNYWWHAPPEGAGAALDALLHALLAVRPLPAPERAAWRSAFDHYVFGDAEPVADHIPPPARGVLGAPTPALLARIRQMLRGAVERL